MKFTFCLLAAATALVDDPWTPGESGINPDVTSHRDIPGDTFFDDIDAESLKEITDLLRACGESEAADEIDAAKENGSVKFQEFFAPEAGIGGTHVKHGDGDTVGLSSGMGEAARAAVLLHEWEHVRNRNGHDGEPPTSDEEEKDPCNHARLHEIGYQKLRDFMADAQNSGEPVVDVTPLDEAMAEDIFDNMSRDDWDCLKKYVATNLGSPIGSSPSGNPSPEDPPQDGEGCN